MIEPVEVVLRGDGQRSVTDVMGFIQARFDEVVAALTAWRDKLGWCPQTQLVESLPLAVAALSPRTTPWAKEAVLRCRGDRWVAYLNEGADPWPATNFIARDLVTQGIVAIHSADSPHASTQLQLFGPTGSPPLLYVRTLAAHCEDGKWSWLANGELQEFEEEHRYSARRIRDRLDRPLLVKYLESMGVTVDDDAFLGSGLVIAKAAA